MKHVISIDIGGTSTRIALIDEAFKIVEKESFPTEVSPEKNVERINEVIKNIGGNIIGIGASCPGPLDLKNGVVLTPPNLKEWHNFPLAQRITDVTGIPCILENDANLATLAEATLGEGKGKDIVQYFTISTGIGGGMVINGEIYQGSKGFAQEVANVILERDGYKLGDLQPGSLESMCSGTAITSRGKSCGLDVEHAGDVFSLAQQGNKEAIGIVEDAKEYLANTCALTYGFLDPDIIILGGGVANKTPGFVEEVERQTKTKVYDVIKDNVVVRKSTLGDDNGILGGGILAFKTFN